MGKDELLTVNYPVCGKKLLRTKQGEIEIQCPKCKQRRKRYRIGCRDRSSSGGREGRYRPGAACKDPFGSGHGGTDQKPGGEYQIRKQIT